MPRILIFDDSAERRRAIGAMMQAHGWVVDEARHGQEALVIARREPPTLILAALQLLALERFATLRLSKATASLAAVPFVAFRTAEVDPRDEELALDLGADAVIAQPEDAGGLVARMRELLGEADRCGELHMRSSVAGDESDPHLDHELLIARLKKRIRALERERAIAAEDGEHLRIALDAARMGTFVRDLKRNRVRWASGYKLLWEGDPRAREQAVDQLESTVHPDDVSAMRRAMQHAIDTNTEYEYEYRVVYNDNVRWILGRGRPYYDEQGKPDRVVGIYFEVTERRRLEQQVRQTQKMEAIGLLAGGIAHDFNNILGAIIGNEELLRRNIHAGQESATYLDEISRASRRAKNLVQQILSFSRNQQVEKSVLAPSAAVLETASLLRATLPADVELVAECAPDAPNVLADPTQLQQVFLNLGTNAWHALGGRPGRIVMQLENAQVSEGGQPMTHARLIPGRYARVIVTDNGSGIPEDVLPRIFDPFFTTKPKGQGTGLGLAVVHEIVSEHHGAVWATTIPGEGSSFHVYIPATEQPEALAAPPVVSLRAGAKSQPLTRCVLYIDDEPALIRVLTRMLKPSGYRVEGFTDVAAAFERFRADPSQFDLAITDLTMPSASGMDVARELLAIRPDLPIVLLSGHVTGERREHARSLGICEVLPKPVTTNELCAAIDRALQG
jgi:signal transduction histidine kinase/DNA-binding response OmpR family regulator